MTWACVEVRPDYFIPICLEADMTETNTITELPYWVLNREVDVTLVRIDPDLIVSTYLLERVLQRGAITVELDDSAQIKINGRPTDLDDDSLGKLCELLDICGSVSSDNVPQVGVTVRSHV